MDDIKKDDKNSKVLKIDHTYPEEEKVNKRKLLFGVLIFLSLCVFIVAVMVKGKEAAIEKESTKNQEAQNDQKNGVKLSEDKEQKDENATLTWNEESLEEDLATKDSIIDSIKETPFVAPEWTNVLLEELSIEKIAQNIAETTNEYKNNPEDEIVEYNLKKETTNKKIIDYFEKKYPNEKVLDFYIWEEMAYYNIKTKEGHYHIDLIQDIWIDGETSTKLNILPMEWVDMETFELYDRYAKDKNNVYRDNEILSWADTRTFVSYDRNYAKDKNNIYCLWDVMEWVDYNTFEVFSEDYAKDKNNVYTYGDVLEWADLETFEVLNEFFAKDKNHIYVYGQIEESLDPATFDPENPEF